MIKMSVIIAIAMSITPSLSNIFKISKKLRGWLSLLTIIILNIINSKVFGDGQVLEAIKIGIEEGVMAVGVYSTGKNTMQFMKTRNGKNVSL